MNPVPGQVAELGAIDIVAMPSLTLMTIFEFAPMWDDDGLPVRLPAALLNVAQLGLLATLNVSLLPSGSEDFGRNE